MKFALAIRIASEIWELTIFFKYRFSACLVEVVPPDFESIFNQCSFIWGVCQGWVQHVVDNKHYNSKSLITQTVDKKNIFS